MYIVDSGVIVEAEAVELRKAHAELFMSALNYYTVAWPAGIAPPSGDST